MIVDAHTQVGDCLFGPSVTAEALVATLDQVGVERAIVAPARPPTYRLEEANDRTAESVQRHGGRLIAFARVDPNQGDGAVRELERAVDDLGMVGLYLHPWEEHFRINGEKARITVAAAGRLGLPVIIEGGYPWMSHPSQVADLTSDFPSVRFLVTNAGQLDLSGLSMADVTVMMRQCPNVSLSTCIMVGMEFLVTLATKTAPERVMYGSGFPQFDPRLEIRRITLAPLSEDVKRRVAGRNLIAWLDRNGEGDGSRG